MQYLISARPLPKYIGKCEGCVRPVLVMRSGATDRQRITCMDCGQPVWGERVYGTVEAYTCTSQCMGASGPSCSCSCGGENHAGVWRGSGEMIASELTAYRDRLDAAEAKREERRAADRARKASLFDEWAEAHTDVLAALRSEPSWVDNPYPNMFLADLLGQVEKHEPLSYLQCERALEIVAGRQRAAARKTEREADAAEVPEGRQEITGEIVSTYTRANYRGDGDDIYIVVRVDTGKGTYRVKGKVPSGIHRDPVTKPGIIQYQAENQFRGRKVTMTATLFRDSEKGTGRFKNPRKADYVS